MQVTKLAIEGTYICQGKALPRARQNVGFALGAGHKLGVGDDVQNVSPPYVSLSFCWAMFTGLWHHQHDLMQIKSHSRRAKSLFCYRGDFLRRTCCNLALRSVEFDSLFLTKNLRDGQFKVEVQHLLKSACSHGSNTKPYEGDL